MTQDSESVIAALAEAETARRQEAVLALGEALDLALADGPDRLPALRRLEKLAVDAGDSRWAWWVHCELKRAETEEDDEEA